MLGLESEDLRESILESSRSVSLSFSIYSFFAYSRRLCFSRWVSSRNYLKSCGGAIVSGIVTMEEFLFNYEVGLSRVSSHAGKELDK